MSRHTIDHGAASHMSGSRRSKHSYRKDVHERIQSHRASKRSSRHSQSQTGAVKVPTRVSDYDNFPPPKYVPKDQSISVYSGVTEKTNGSRTFNKNKTYQEKMYNEKMMTQNTGRIVLVFFNPLVLFPKLQPNL